MSVGYRPSHSHFSLWHLSLCQLSLWHLSLWILAILSIIPCPRLGAGTPPGGWAQAEANLKKAVRSRSVELAKSIVEKLARTRETRGLRLILRYALRGEQYGLYSYSAGVLLQVKEPGLRREIYTALGKSPNPRTRIILLAVVRRWPDDPEAMAALHARLSDRRKEVVFATLRWIRHLGEKKLSVGPLVSELERRERRIHDRVFYDLRKSLTHLTGFDLETSADWRNYYETYKNNLNKAPKRGSKGRTRLASAAKFFTVAVDSTRVLFLIDVSGSMAVEDVINLPGEEEEGEEEGEVLGDGTTVVKIPRPRGKTTSGRGKRSPGQGNGEDDEGKPSPPAQTLKRSRITAVKQELIRTIGNLPTSVHFNIMNFNHEVRFFHSGPGLIQATGANKNKAARWVASLAPSGATRTDVALKRALKLQDVDTIYLLTDGAPKKINNERIPPEKVLGYVQHHNRFRKCRINTIGFSQAGMTMQQFCMDLAKQNDGRCVLLK